MVPSDVLVMVNLRTDLVLVRGLQTQSARAQRSLRWTLRVATRAEATTKIGAELHEISSRTNFTQDPLD